MSTRHPDERLFIADVARQRRRVMVRDLKDGTLVPLASDAVKPRSGSVVVAATRDGVAHIDTVLADPGSALAKLYRLAAAHGLDPLFDARVGAEVAVLIANPGIDDPSLIDLTALPFVTVDGPETRDLDQALCIERENGGYRVDYALADASFSVRPGTALFEEALRRGASFYLPGLSIPMLPRALSEGIVSLNEGELRRAMVFRMHLDPSGHSLRTEVVRARIRSRAKLSFDDVDRFLSGQKSAVPAAASESLRLLVEVGRLRLADAERRDVIHYRRAETEVRLGRRKMRFVVVGGMRSDVERYNEQLSLLCNIEGARLLREHDKDDGVLQPIYRVHPTPDPTRFEELERLLTALCKCHHLDPAHWMWSRAGSRSLAEFLAALPDTGREGRVAKAIHRQAVMINVRSTFTQGAESHHGVGAEVYARFSSPMREIVGVFLHKEAFERFAPSRSTVAGNDDELRTRVVARANDARLLQQELTKQANLMVLDQIFEDDDKRPFADRPRRIGTVMGLTRGKAHVLLDSPAIEVKLYTRHLEEPERGSVRLSEDGTALGQAGRTLCRIGDGVRVVLAGREDGRWKLVLA